MATPSSAPTGGAGRPAPRFPGPPGPGQFRPPPGQGQFRPPPKPKLTSQQQMRLALVSAIMIVLGLGLGLIASIALPHIYAAETTIRYNLGETSATSDNADRTLTTQTVLITGREVLQPVADSTGVPIDYLTENTTAAVVPNSEIIDVQVKHPDRASGIQLADAIAKRYLEVANGTGNRNQLQAQLDNAQRQLSNPTTTPAGQLDLAGQVDDLQNQLAASANTSNIAAIVAPAYSVTAAVFPDTLITLGIGALVGAVAAGAIGYRMFRNWTRG